HNARTRTEIRRSVLIKSPPQSYAEADRKCAFSVTSLYSRRTRCTASIRSTQLRFAAVSSCSTRASQYSVASSIPATISSATRLTKSVVVVAVLAICVPPVGNARRRARRPPHTSYIEVTGGRELSGNHPAAPSFVGAPASSAGVWQRCRILALSD